MFDRILIKLSLSTFIIFSQRTKKSYRLGLSYFNISKKSQRVHSGDVSRFSVAHLLSEQS